MSPYPSILYHQTIIQSLLSSSILMIKRPLHSINLSNIHRKSVSIVPYWKISKPSNKISNLSLTRPWISKKDSIPKKRFKLLSIFWPKMPKKILVWRKKWMSWRKNGKKIQPRKLMFIIFEMTILSFYKKFKMWNYWMLWCPPHHHNQTYKDLSIIIIMWIDKNRRFYPSL